jgi:hypothetical protein
MYKGESDHVNVAADRSLLMAITGNKYKTYFIVPLIFLFSASGSNGRQTLVNVFTPAEREEADTKINTLGSRDRVTS